MKYIIFRSIEGSNPEWEAMGPIAFGLEEGKEAEPSATVKLECDDLKVRDVAKVAQEKGVEAVAPVMPMKLIAPVKLKADADPKADGSTWGVKAVRADTSPFSGKGTIVAVLDTGIDAAHPAFDGVTLIQKNFTGEADQDLNGHGTHCAGTIFGRDVSGVRIGIAPGVKKALIGKVLGKGGGGSDVIGEAILWALHEGAHIISMSLGIDFPGFVVALEQQGVPPKLATSMALEGYRANLHLFERIAECVKAFGAFGGGCILVAAAGNDSRRDIKPDFEIAVRPPAVAEGILSVSAVGQEPGGFTVAPFSNFGARLSAPGVGVVSAKRGGGLATKSGTSMAAPHVAGVAALWAEKLWSQGHFTGQLLMDYLIGSATKDGMKAGFDPVDVGAGIVRAPQN